LFTRRIWVSILILDRLSSIKQTLGTKTHKNYYHIGILEAIGLKYG
jgi:hypothetical protein